MVATNSQPVTLAETLDRIEATWRDWVLALEAVDPARRAEPGVCGWWSVKDLMAHIALWESVVPEHIQRWRLGLPEADHDVDLMNAEIVAENHNRSHALVRVDMHRAHQIALAAIREIDRDLDDDVRARIACETWDHYPEHTAQVRDWLAGNARRSQEGL